ncbi:MAG: hypothetical protein LBU07_05115 [Coriobacteriales bacterium]|nr:hypothetical protein [Coriobacteriales bacterium]
MSIDISATPLTGLFYEQEFGRGILPDINECVKNEDRYILLKAAWSMAKTAAYPARFLSFDAWASGLGNIDFQDYVAFEPIIQEINHGFFRGASDTGGKRRKDVGSKGQDK